MKIKKGLLYCLLLMLPFSAIASEKIQTTGDYLQIAIPALAFGTTVAIGDKEGSVQFIKSFATTVAVTHGLKLTVDKKRPNGDSQSFPSGHTSAAFQGAAFFHKRYGLKYGLPAYLGASFVGYSRVESDKHYVEDVLFGAAIGIASVFYFTTPYENAVITPVVSQGFYGLQLTSIW